MEHLLKTSERGGTRGSGGRSSAGRHVSSNIDPVRESGFPELSKKPLVDVNFFNGFADDFLL